MSDRSVSWEYVAQDKSTATLVRIGEELGRLGRQIKEASGTVNVDADTAHADEKLRETRREEERLDGKTARVNVNADTAAAMTKVALLAAAITALAPLGLAAFGGLVGVGAVAAAGIGAVGGAVSGVGDAVTAMGQQTAAAGGSASNAAATMRRANEQIRSSEEALTRAQRDAKLAQQDLTRARQDAKRQLEDLQQQTEDMALSQKRAALDVIEAKAAADKAMVDPTLNQEQRDSAQLAYQEALQRQKDLGTQATRLAQDKAAADRKGVEGSDQVVQAQRKLQDATQAVADAQVRLKEAQLSAAEAGQQAAGGGAAAMNKLAQAMANLSPAGQEFARFMRGFIDGPLKQLRFSAQTGFLPGLEAGMKRLAPIFGPLNAALLRFSTVLGQAIGGLIPIMGKLALPFMNFASAALKGLQPLEGVLGRFAAQFGAVIQKLTSSGAIQQAMGGLVGVMGALLPILPPLVDMGVRMLDAFGPSLATTVTALVVGLQPLLAEMPDLATAVAQLLVALSPLLPVIGMLAAQFGSGLASAIRTVMPLVTGIISFIVAHQAYFGAIASEVLTLVAALRIWTMVQGVLNVVMSANPIALVVIAVAGLAAGVIYAYKHSETFRAIVQAVGRAAAAAFGWVLSAVQSVVNWIRGHWPLLLGILTGPFGPAIAWIISHWGQVTSFFGKVVSGIGRVFGGVINLITAPFKGAFNAVASMFNRTIGAMNVQLPDWMGGYSVHMPTIPMLAKGGIVTGPTIAMLGEAGREAVIPLPSNGKLGGGDTYITMPVTVQAGVGDPVAIARKIEEVLAAAKARGHKVTLRANVAS